MQLRVLSTMAEVSTERNSTLIFPLPIELLRLVDTLTTRPDGGSPRPALWLHRPRTAENPAP